MNAENKVNTGKYILLFSSVLVYTVLSTVPLYAKANDDPELFAQNHTEANRYIGIMPPNVRTIACISPGSHPGKPLHHKGIELLRKAGYKVKVMPHAFVRQKHIARAPVEGKLSDFYSAWNDPEIDMIFCIRGGMGTEELMDHLDWSKLKKRPELYVQGYSDATLLVCGLLAKGKGHPIAGFMSGSMPRLTDDAVDAAKKINHGKQLGPIKVDTLVPGVCRGFPIGGSLWKLSRLAGKEYCPDTAGKIIFIEASRMQPEVIRKKLMELLNKKFFDRAAGVVFGLFASCGSKEKVQAVLKEFSAKLNIPVVSNYPFGHVPCCYSIDFLRPVEMGDGYVTFPEVK